MKKHAIYVGNRSIITLETQKTCLVLVKLMRIARRYWWRPITIREIAE